jgi:hypothetical protein
MNKKNVLAFSVGFIAGTGIGTAVTHYILSKKLVKEVAKEKKALEELFGSIEELSEEEVKNLEFEEVDDDKKKVAAEANNKPDIMEYKNRVKHFNYSTRTPMEMEKPRVIDEEEYLEQQNRNVVLCTYFAGDGVFIEDVSEKEINMRKTFGVAHVGELFDGTAKEGDLAYVRDDSKRIDYEITYTKDSFKEEEEILDE